MYREIWSGVMKKCACLLILVLLLTGCGDSSDQHYVKVSPTYGMAETVGTETDESSIHEATQDDVDEMNGGRKNSGEKETTTESAASETEETTARSYVIALDPGHGGDYSGATNGSYIEKELTLKLSLMIKDYLETNYDNVTVFMTRTDDTTLSDDLAEDLDLRVKNAKEAGADIYLSIHFNASDNHDRHGSQICVSRAENITDGCYALADSILTELEKLGFTNNGPYQRDSNDTFDENGDPVDYYAINRHGAENDLIAVIVENCYIDNDTDVALFDTDEKLQLIAMADAVGAMNYLESSYSESPSTEE